ncbi:MAG: PadR family transcriptional regulator [Candidatus Thorarchaeota archaeon]
MSKLVKLFLPTPEKLTPIQALILIQLLETSKYGYEILRGLREGFKGAWEPKTGTIYPALQALEKKGHITKKINDEKTHYSLTDQGREIMQEMSNYVADYLLFNSRFIESTVDSMPPLFTQEVFAKIHMSGLDEILPEATILEAIRDLPDRDLKRVFLELRKNTLQRKLRMVKNHLKDLDK